MLTVIQLIGNDFTLTSTLSANNNTAALMETLRRLTQRKHLTQVDRSNVTAFLVLGSCHHEIKMLFVVKITPSDHFCFARLLCVLLLVAFACLVHWSIETHSWRAEQKLVLSWNVIWWSCLDKPVFHACPGRHRPTCMHIWLDKKPTFACLPWKTMVLMKAW